MSATSRPTLSIPHGGGPYFVKEPPAGRAPDIWDRMAAFGVAK